MPKLSVIIPIYNAEKYIKYCLDSVLTQSFEDIEILCINDGSIDKSGEILAEYAMKDSRIRVIEKENTGYGHSMNVGFEAAKGEYIGIVESDDKIQPDFFETLYNCAKEHDLDIVKSECYFWWENADYKYRFHLSGLDKYYNTVILRNKTWLRCQFLMNTWTGIYRRQFIKEFHIKHHESPGASYQDNGFWMQGMLQADRVMILNYAGYYYRQDNEAASIKDDRKVYAMSDEYQWLDNQLSGRISIQERDVLNVFRLTRSYWNLIRISDDYKRKYCDRLISEYENYGNVFYRDLIWQDIFEKIKDDPDGFCKSIITNKKKVKQQLDKADSIIIYGAGRRAELIFRTVCNNGWLPKLRYFVETSELSKDYIGCVKVCQIDKANMQKSSSIVIISAAEKTKADNDMREKLSMMGITNILSSESILENFYLIC